jgi:hypothetical protein
MANTVRSEDVQVEGFTRCVAPSCPDFDVELRVDLVKSTRIERAQELPVDLNTQDHYHLAR